MGCLGIQFELGNSEGCRATNQQSRGVQFISWGGNKSLVYFGDGEGSLHRRLQEFQPSMAQQAEGKEVRNMQLPVRELSSGTEVEQLSEGYWEGYGQLKLGSRLLLGEIGEFKIWTGRVEHRFGGGEER